MYRDAETTSLDPFRERGEWKVTEVALDPEVTQHARHASVATAEGDLLALCGPAGEQESQRLARLFAAARELEGACGEAALLLNWMLERFGPQLSAQERGSAEQTADRLTEALQRTAHTPRCSGCSSPGCTDCADDPREGVGG